MSTMTNAFRQRVEAFLDRSGMKPTTLGKAAVKDPGFVFALRRGRAPNLSTAEKVVSYMEEWEQERLRRAQEIVRESVSSGEGGRA